MIGALLTSHHSINRVTNNSHPIITLSLLYLNFLSKSLILQHLEANHILSDHQYMASAIPIHVNIILIILLHDIYQRYDTRIQTNIIFTDFAKAFDIVPQKHLLYKME